MKIEIKNPLETAQKLVGGDRQKVYGHPLKDFTKTAKIWSAILDMDVTPKQVALCMIGVKISRLVQSPHHEDTMVDIAGYLQTYWMVIEEEERLCKEKMDNFVPDAMKNWDAVEKIDGE
jgi:hypothetical protein